MSAYTAQKRLVEATGATDAQRLALQQMNADLRAKTATRTLKPDPKNATEFAALEGWQQKRYCANLSAPQVAAADTRGPGFEGAGADNALADATAIRNQTTPQQQAPAAAWSKDESDAACNELKRTAAITDPAPITGPATTTPGNQTTNVPVPPGVEKEQPEKGPNPWLTAPLVVSAAKGAVVGLLLGSLFGPVGLIAGPLLGAAAFYGITKVTGGG